MLFFFGGAGCFQQKMVPKGGTLKHKSLFAVFWIILTIRLSMLHLFPLEKKKKIIHANPFFFAHFAIAKSPHPRFFSFPP